MFDLLVFTDATSAESLSGSPGFQFIARSPGASPTDEAIVKEQQHILPLGLPDEDWAQHPATCAFVRSGDRMYLSRGHSIGRTLGGRLGNQLTVTLMTSEPYDILPLRPAQLYSSPAWDFSRPVSKDIPGWESPVEIDEDFDILGLHALVANDPWAASVLPNILSMLDQTQAERRKRLLIRHPDQALIMRWVALLSHFLDSDRALRFEFRVFTDAPLRSNQHVVGVHPTIAPDLTVDSARQEGVNLIDLERQELTSVDPTESAIRYSRWFITADPYEALEAIDVGRRWSRDMDPDLAAVAAEVATMGAPPDASIRGLRAALNALHALARAGKVDELDEYGDSLADLAASSPPTNSADLLHIDAALWAVAAAGDAELAQSLAVAALEWAADQPAMFSDWAMGVQGSAQLVWRDEELRRHAAGLVASALAATDIHTLPSAFSLAYLLNTGVSAELIADPVRRLADAWASNPGLASEARGWVQHAAVIDQLERALDSRLSASDPSSMQALLDGAWDWISPVPWVVDSRRPMSRWMAVRELRGANSDDRKRVLLGVQAELPSSAWRVMLPIDGTLDPDEVANWIKSHRDLDPTLAVAIERTLDDLRRYPAWRRSSGGVSVLNQIGKLTGNIPQSLRALAANQSQILDLFNRAYLAKEQPSNTALLRLHSRYPQMLNGLYGDWITRAILESQDVYAAIALAEGGGQSRVVSYTRDKLEEQLRAPTRTAMLSAVRLLDPSLGVWAEAATSALNAVWDDKSTESIRDWLVSSVDGRLNRNQLERLEQFLDSQSKGRFTRGVMRGAKSVLTSRDKKK